MLRPSNDGGYADVLVYADRNRGIGALALEGLSDGLVYGSRRATRADLRGFGAGLALPHFRAFDV